ncbi:hypothetical protein HJB90_08940 [Rhizobium sp. NLR10a]|uniref:PGN_0703 family putative restriction endonuclease n=1 Tax=unclassified Rhizobium TaxID=2613769 RepID=UPI001C82D327|nr:MULTISPECIES: hypothetical protein [unclassified Rhizobium]MBX5213970.1 hypothetical protein [Rhizobium sp. NLR9a]MBX5218881.1 hypothetical protein [Rhizobium sp. NLR8a]MBX5275359.1 hypothetical protein [Rhizobium sp. NLR13a]MBX5281146.1 hypothetical protein [Rhizobium sp. NLR10a]MBX5297542.1 hypothetical protein [Rhizobium sp. NLR15a]
MNFEFQAVRENLFPASHAAIEDWEAFPWHRDRTNRIQAHKAHSSQAIAIDVLGTIKMSTDRDRIFDAIASTIGVAPGGPWAITLEWTDRDRLLGEPRPTQVDALAVGSKAALVIECKFTEPGGQCSQTAVLRSGERQCNGSYTNQINPGNGLRAHCALTGKGIHYWEYIPKVFGLDPTVDHTPCPFKADGYQWMRNAVLAAALGKHHNLQSAALAAFADHPSFPTAQKVKQGLMDPRLSGQAAITPISYQQIIAIACHVGLDQELWNDLSEWVGRKIAMAALRRSVFQEV